MQVYAVVFCRRRLGYLFLICTSSDVLGYPFLICTSSDICKKRCTIILLTNSLQIAEPDPHATVNPGSAQVPPSISANFNCKPKFAIPSQPAQLRRLCSQHRAPAPPIVDTDVSLSQPRTKLKRAALSAKRAKKNPVNDTESDTISHKDPITAVHGVHDDNEDVKDAKLKVSTMGMDKVKVNRNNDNEVKNNINLKDDKNGTDKVDGIAVDGVNDDDEDVKDTKLKVNTMGMDKIEVNRNNGNEVVNDINFKDDTKGTDKVDGDGYKDVEDDDENVGHKPLRVSNNYNNQKRRANKTDDVDQDIHFKDKSNGMDEVVGDDNDDNEDDRYANFEGNKDGKDKNVMREVRLHSQYVHISPPQFP